MQDFAAIANVLQSELGFPEGNLYEGCSMEFANRLWLQKSFGKKFLPSGLAEKLANDACLELFKLNNLRCASFQLRPEGEMEERVVEEVKHLFDLLLHCGPDTFIDRDGISSRMMVGPGASQGATSNDFYTKLFAGPLTCTTDLLYRVYRDCLRSDPRWHKAEKLRFDTFGVRQVVGNRLSFAPKTSIISRSICTEPGLNMLFQLGIGSLITDRLKQVFKIDLSTQPAVNRRLAQIGSIDGTYGTIDLSSASDSMSLNVLKELLPPEFLKWLWLSRSPIVTFPDGSCSELHMVSSMGNGFTFPLQTYLFASIVSAAYRISGTKPKYGRNPNLGVFGDDIVVVKDLYNFVIRCLELFGFTVNGDKSFNDGSFRESCGGDFFRGSDIRGVYIRSLKHDADVYSAINRLVRWSSRSGVLVPETLRLLRTLIRGKTLWIPWKDGDAEGIKIPEPPIGLQVSPRSGALKYQALTSKRSSYRLPNSAADERLYPFKNGKRTKVFFNPDGLMVACLAGFVRSERIGLRTLGADTFKIQARTTVNWSGTVPPFDAQEFLQTALRTDQSGRCFGTLAPKGPNLVGNLSPVDEWKFVAALYFP